MNQNGVKVMTTYILLVEDDDMTRRVLERLLQHEGYGVTTATDGEIALEYLANGHHFDIVITDIDLGDINGIQVLKTARQLERAPTVIVMTGDSSLDLIIEALRAGASDYMLKPCNSEEFLQRVAINVRNHAQELRRIDALRTIVRVADELRQPELTTLA
jgi:DNA-binding response OmpR family regulator